MEDNIELLLVENENKKVLYNLLQFALYDGSLYTERKVLTNGEFEYKWFENYFIDNDRQAYIIKYNGDIAGCVMINQNMKILNKGYSIAEFLVLPAYRRKGIGKKVFFEILDKYNDSFEIEPIENSEIAYNFWKNVINEYTNGCYKEENVDNNSIFLIEKS